MNLIKFKGYAIDAAAVVAVSSVYAEVDTGAFAFMILLSGGHTVTVCADVGAPERKSKLARWEFLRQWRKARNPALTQSSLFPT